MFAKLLLTIIVPLGGKAITSPAATEGTGGLGIDSRPAAILVETHRIKAHRVELVAFGDVDPESLLYPVWSLDAYAAGEPPLRYLSPTGPAEVSPWGNAGLAGGFRDTVRIVQPVTGFLPPTGQVVVGVESTTRTLLAGAEQARDATYMGAVWQTADGVRGLLPHSITWGLDVYASFLQGEIVPPIYRDWERAFGSEIDGSDVLEWQRTVTWSATTVVGEGDFRAWWVGSVLLLCQKIRIT